jgi:hypothetical protein
MSGLRILCALAALATALVLAACGSDDDATTTGATGAAGAAGGPGQAMEDTTPAEIVDNPQGFISSDVVRPIENAWRAGGHNSFTEVDAGALAHDPDTGAFAIFRYDFRAIEQEMNLVEVKDAGALTITSAPTGEDVVDSAQEDAEIEFEGESGITGTLHLSDDTVTLDE